MQTIGLIGGGNMAEAIIKGIVRTNLENPLNILLHEPNKSRCETLGREYRLHFCESNGELVQKSDVILLAIKPQVSPTVLKEIAPHVDGKQLILSIMAGVPTAAIENAFSSPVRVVRAMPNMPATVGEGVTALCAGSHAESGDLLTAEELFSGIGTVLRVEEKQMDAVTGLSGSGPAYVYMLIEALASGGVFSGLPRGTALQLAIQTVLGSAKLASVSALHPAILCDQVCSPGGTTIAGVKALEEHGFRNAAMEAVIRATQRSKELGKA
ncbi:MAG: pyrroline-5-carboxylate reductase [bacterium]|nr:pyrroline-5-carboxylate reductase [bacterium]